MGMPSGMELLVVVGVIVLLFGGKKIPELAKGLGKGIKDFKQAVREDDEDTKPTASAKEIEQKSEATAEISSTDTQKSKQA